ncbi:hypothetical protein [Butyrivibrio fibrisolvens]|uniref:hypothetical protein n=1 Tax=Butyrivibrio fibrisolvens TaxID=831 RepID=UPI001788B8AB|nr:hypothetical protein [Butyrivibrio fibrisolvens]
MSNREIIAVEADESGTPDFYVMRQAEVNPRVKDKRKISILWRTELNHLLERNDLPKYKEKSKLFVQEKLLEKVLREILVKRFSKDSHEDARQGA